MIRLKRLGALGAGALGAILVMSSSCNNDWICEEEGAVTLEPEFLAAVIENPSCDPCEAPPISMPEPSQLTYRVCGRACAVGYDSVEKGGSPESCEYRETLGDGSIVLDCVYGYSCNTTGG